MQTSLTTLALAFLSCVAAERELTIVKKDGKHVVVKGKGQGQGQDTLWYTLSLTNGIPALEIKGSEKDDETTAKARMQLALNTVSESGLSEKFSLAGSESYWTDIKIEEQGDAKDLKQIILRSTMVRPEKDVAGNFFTIELQASVDRNSDGFTLHPMIQNFPYDYAKGKGILLLEQSVEATTKAALSAGSDGIVSVGSFGSVQVDTESAFEDGNPGTIKGPSVGGKDSAGGRAKGMKSQDGGINIQFSTSRPKNATFTERLSFNPHLMKLDLTEKKDLDEGIKGASASGAPSPLQGSSLLGLGAAVVAGIIAFMY